MSNKVPIVLFVCEHGSAKSTIAAAHFNKIVRDRNLNAMAISRGTDPDEEYPENVTAGLRGDGVQIEESRPRKLRDSEVAAAAYIVFFNEPFIVHPADLRIRDWSDVPPVSEDYGIARDEILKRVQSVVQEFYPGTRMLPRK